jgi:hypothetical protein
MRTAFAIIAYSWTMLRLDGLETAADLRERQRCELFCFG